MTTKRLFLAATLPLLISVLAMTTSVRAQEGAAAIVSAAAPSAWQSPSGQQNGGARTPQTHGGAATPAPTPSPNKPVAIPMTARQKLRYGLRETFLTSGAYLGPAVNAYFTERRDVKALGKTGEDKFADGLSRFGRAFATRASGELLGSGVYPALFKQNPIYQPSGRQKFLPRALYGASRALITSGDNGKSQPNFSRMLGNLTSSSLANLYERDTVARRDARGRVLQFNRRSGLGPTLQSFGISTALDALNYAVFEEFDVLRKLKAVLKRP